MTKATILLPAADRLGGPDLDHAFARAFGRADRATASAGRRPQLLRHFQIIPNHWPIAALTRQLDAGDAAGAGWLRVDPCYVRPDINGVRLMACGEMLALDAEDCAALVPALRPLFGDAGVPIDAPTPSRWYLRLPVETRLPAFTEPDDALGSDLFDHLAEGDAGRRWRTLLGEAQVVLHNHPWNAQRVAQGRLPVNSLWFWGGGVLPDQLRTQHACMHSDDATARALAQEAGIDHKPLPAAFAPISGEAHGNFDNDLVYDLQGVRDLQALQQQWLQPALQALRGGMLDSLALDQADGTLHTLARSQRWRFWRRPLQRWPA